MKNKMKKYIQIDHGGNVLRDLLTSIDYSDRKEYILIDREQSDMLLRGMNKIRWDFEQETLVMKKQIKFVVGTTRFPADGETSVAICVRGDGIGEEEPVSIRINDTPYTITKRDHLELTSDEPGIFNVSLSDDNYTASPSSYTIYAIKEEQNNGTED